jgi:hypothetical protein
MHSWVSVSRESRMKQAQLPYTGGFLAVGEKVSTPLYNTVDPSQYFRGVPDL